MADIWEFEPGKLVPYVEFKMEWKGEGTFSDTMPDAIVTGALSEKRIKLRVSGLLFYLYYSYIAHLDTLIYVQSSYLDGLVNCNLHSHNQEVT